MVHSDCRVTCPCRIVHMGPLFCLLQHLLCFLTVFIYFFLELCWSGEPVRRWLPIVYSRDQLLALSNTAVPQHEWPDVLCKLDRCCARAARGNGRTLQTRPPWVPCHCRDRAHRPSSWSLGISIMSLCPPPCLHSHSSPIHTALSAGDPAAILCVLLCVKVADAARCEISLRLWCIRYQRHSWGKPYLCEWISQRSKGGRPSHGVYSLVTEQIVHSTK